MQEATDTPTGRGRTRATANASNGSVPDQVEFALTWLKRHSRKATLAGMVRYSIPSDHAFGVAMKDIKALGTRLLLIEREAGDERHFIKKGDEHGAACYRQTQSRAQFCGRRPCAAPGEFDGLGGAVGREGCAPGAHESCGVGASQGIGTNARLAAGSRVRKVGWCQDPTTTERKDARRRAVRSI
jgi:hypothetical protein